MGRKGGNKGSGTTARIPASRRLARLWRDNRHVVKTWAVFLGVFGLVMVVLSLTRGWLEPRANAWTATLAALALRLLGQEGEAAGTLVVSSMTPVEIIWECTGITPIGIFLSAVVAFPASWKAKGLGLLLGVPTLLLINLVRVVSLVYVAHLAPEAFETAHVFVWQSLIIFLTVLLWLLWTVTLAGPREASAA